MCDCGLLRIRHMRHEGFYHFPVHGNNVIAELVVAVFFELLVSRPRTLVDLLLCLGVPNASELPLPFVAGYCFNLQPQIALCLDVCSHASQRGIELRQFVLDSAVPSLNPLMAPCRPTSDKYPE